MKTIKVWDFFVRIFHWSLVLAIISQLVTAEDFKGAHATAGYFIIALITLRIIWGFIGSRHARFKDFIYPPAAILDYLKGLFLRRPKHYIGHNPAGGAMVCLLLLVLMLTTLTGLLAYGAEGKGPLAWRPIRLVTIASAHDEPKRSDDHRDRHAGDEYKQYLFRDREGAGERNGLWKEVHETLAGILIFLAGVHVCGVMASSYIHKENFVLAMLTGKKRLM